MGAIGNLIPLVLLFAVVAGVGWVGYQVSLSHNERTYSSQADSYYLTDLPLHQRAHRTRRPQVGEEERCVYQGRG